MTKEKINSLSVCMLIFALSKASFLGIGFIYIYEHAETSALYSVLLGILIGGVAIYVFQKLMDFKPEKSITEKTFDLFPRVLAHIINFILVISALVMAILAFWRLVDFLTSQYLTATPSIIIGLLIISIIFYTLIKNLEVMTRFSTITFFICAVILLVNIGGLIPYVELDNLKPLTFGKDFGFIKSSLVFATLFSGPCFFMTIIPKDNIVDKEKFNKMFWKFYMLSAFVLFLIFFFTITCLGTGIIDIYTYPVYIVLKKITFFSFVESIENVSFLLWYLYLHILCLMSLYFIKNTIIQVFKIKRKTRNVVIISLFLCILTLTIPYFILENNYILSVKIYKILPIGLNVLYIFISILFFVIILFKKKYEK